MNWEIFWSVSAAIIVNVLIVGYSMRQSYASFVSEADKKLRCTLADYSSFLDVHRRIERRVSKLESALGSIKPFGDDTGRKLAAYELRREQLRADEYRTRQGFTHEEQLDQLIEQAESRADKAKQELDSFREDNDE